MVDPGPQAIIYVAQPITREILLDFFLLVVDLFLFPFFIVFVILCFTYIAKYFQQ